MRPCCISKVITNVYGNMLYKMTYTQARWHNDNSLNMYSECLPFKLLLRHRLPRLRFFGGVSQPFQVNSRMGYDYFLPNHFQFICHITTHNTVTKETDNVLSSPHPSRKLRKSKTWSMYHWYQFTVLLSDDTNIFTYQQGLVHWCHGRSPLFFSFRLCH